MVLDSELKKDLHRFLNILYYQGPSTDRLIVFSIYSVNILENFTYSGAIGSERVAKGLNSAPLKLIWFNRSDYNFVSINTLKIHLRLLY